MENGFLTRNQGLDMVEKITGFVKSRTYDRNAIDGLLNDKQDVLTFDNTPTENSTNPVTSGGVYTAISNPDLYEVNIFYDFTLDRFRIPTEYTQSGYAVYKNGEDITNTITNFKTFVDNLNNTNNILKFYSVKSPSTITPTNHCELLRNCISSNNVATRFNVYNSDVVGTISFRADEIACTFRESTIDVVDRIVEDTYGCNVRIVLDVTDIPDIDIDLDNVMFANVEDYVQTIKYTKYKVNNTSYTYDTEVTYTDSIIKFINNVLPSLNAHYNLSITVDIIKSTGESSEESRECYAEYINHKVNNAGYYDNYLKLSHDFRASGASDIYDYPQNSMQYVGLIVVPSVEHPEATSYCKFARVVDTELTENSNNYITSGTMFDIVGNYYTKTETDNLLNDKQDALTFDTVPTDESENPVTSDGIYNDIHINIAEDSTYESVKTLSNCGAFPMLSLTAEINAVQDLHGYDKPWAGGAGKNKLPINSLSISGGGITATIDRDSNNNVVSITVNGTASGTVYVILNTFTLPSGTYTMSGCPSNGGSDSYRLYDDKHVSWADNGSGASFTLSEASQVAPTIRIANGYTVNNLKFYPMIESGSSKTTFEPYSNICPISGWSEVNVNVSGVNVWDEEWEAGGFWGNGTPRADFNGIRSKNYIPTSPNLTMSATFPFSFVFFYDKDKTVLSYAVTNTTFTTPANCAYFKFATGLKDGAYYGTTYNNDISINYPSTDTSYHAYNGQTYTTALSTTCYGGSKDIKGNERFTHGHIASYNGETLPGAWISDRDEYAEGTTPTIGAEVVYELSTPTTATSDAIDLTLAEGVNNVWASSGDVGDARYIVKNAASDIITAIKDICYTKTEIDSMIGDISNALDTINGEVV